MDASRFFDFSAMRKVVSPREIIRGDYYTKSPLI